MADVDLLRDDFLPNLEGATVTFAVWRKEQPGEYKRWVAYRDQVLAGQSPAAPAVSSRFAKALIAAGQMAQGSALDLAVFRNKFLPNAQRAIVTFAVWKKRYPKEFTAWVVYRDAVLAGEWFPQVPMPTSRFGEAIVAGGQMAERDDMKVTLSTSGGTQDLTGTVTVTATVVPSPHVTSVKFFVDDVLKSTDTTAPYTYAWDTSLVSAGAHQLKAQALVRNQIVESMLDVTVAGAVPPDPPPPIQAVPVNTVLPTISDTTPQEGQTISVDVGSWENSPVRFTYQWQRCDGAGANCVAIASATGFTYTCSAGDVGTTLRCSITAHNAIGASQPAQTAQTSAVSALAVSVPVLVAGGTPVITGTPIQGNALGISNGSWTNSPTSYNRQWRRCDPSPISSSINEGDTIVSGQVWTVTTVPAATLVEFYVDGSQVGTDTSEPYQTTLALSAGAHLLGIAATINGVRTVYVTPGAGAGVWANITSSAGPAVFNGAGVAISGATASQYSLTSADVGSAIRCVTTAVNATGNSIPVQSGATAIVTSSVAPPPPGPATPWTSYRYEVSLSQVTIPNRHFTYKADGSLDLTCFSDTPFLGSDRQLVSAYLPGGAQSAEGRRVRYETRMTFPADFRGTTGELNFWFEWHTMQGAGAGQLSCAIGGRCDYPVDYTIPGENLTWFFRPIGPGGSPPLSEMIGPRIPQGVQTSYDLKVEVKWSSTAGEFKVFLDGVQLRHWFLPTLWSGDVLALGIYHYRIRVPFASTINFTKPVVTVL